MTTYKKQIILPWAKAVVEDETRWEGTTAYFHAHNEAKSSTTQDGYAKITRILNGGDLLEIIWRGQETSIRVSAEDYNIHIVELCETANQSIQIMPLLDPEEAGVTSFFVKETQGAYKIFAHVVKSLQTNLGQIMVKTHAIASQQQAHALCDHLNSQLVNATEIQTKKITLANDEVLEMCFIKELATGNVFALEASYVEQEAGEIQSPYDNGLMTLGEDKKVDYFPKYNHEPDLAEQMTSEAFENYTKSLLE